MALEAFDFLLLSILWLIYYSGAYDLPDADESQSSVTDSEPAAKSSGGMSLVVKVIILLVLLFFVYLVYINMEPSSGNRVPKIKGD